MSICVESSGEPAYDYQLQTLIRNGLRKLVPPGSLWEGDEFSVLDRVPVVKLTSLTRNAVASVILVCELHVGVERFFYEMVSKWLCPGKKTDIISFVHSCFSYSSRRFSFCEARFVCSSEWEYEQIQGHFSQLESEIEQGVTSVYRAHRILEVKGLFSSEKNALIHEEISSLLHRRSRDFDYDVFGQMQHFLIGCKEEFKQIREHRHLTRIIYVMYLFRKTIKKMTESAPEGRHVSFKVGRVRLHFPFGIRRVLGVFIGLNLLRKHELFEERHLIKALKDLIPEVAEVEGSRFSYIRQDEGIRILYLEIQKKGESDFSEEEIRYLRDSFPIALENQIEKLMPSVFMPRNEEEVMKNLLILSRELRYTKDIPQCFISFEEQTEANLTFTVILLRIVSEISEKSLSKLFEEEASELTFMEDRVKLVGFLRKKYAKEATVFRLKMPKASYMRSDHFVDLIEARQAVVKEVRRVVGDFRDYNGGMIAKQAENLRAFKTLLAIRHLKEEQEVESFFHALFPVEMRSVVAPELLKSLYELLQNVEKKTEEPYREFLRKNEECFLVARFSSDSERSEFVGLIKKLRLQFSRSVFFSFEKRKIYYSGYLFFGVGEEQELRLKEVFAGEGAEKMQEIGYF